MTAEDKEFIYKEVDAFLLAITTNLWSIYNLKIKDWNKKQFAISLMENHGLIEYLRPDKGNASVLRITPTGLEVLESGGISVYLKALRTEKEQERQLSALEFEKIRNDMDLIQRQLNDYRFNKYWAIGIAVLTISMSAIALWLQLRGK